MDTLECRRNMYSVVFVRDLIHNNVNCSFYSPQRSLRENFHFRLNLNRSNVSNNGCISRSILITNKVIKYIDVFVTSSGSFKNELLYVLNYKLQFMFNFSLCYFFLIVLCYELSLFTSI